MSRFSQKTLFCTACGRQPEISSLCAACYRQRQHSLRFFAGEREEVLLRDGYRCQGCGAGNQRAVHHRRPGVHASEWLATICPACHAVVHKLLAPRRWLPVSLLTLWREQHPRIPLQLQLSLEEESWGREARTP